jgi:hypothetical protein
MYACMHVCMYACMHVCMYACMHVCMYACMHVCMYACMHVCMYACMHVCMYVRLCKFCHVQHWSSGLIIMHWSSLHRNEHKSNNHQEVGCWGGWTMIFFMPSPLMIPCGEAHHKGRGVLGQIMSMSWNQGWMVIAAVAWLFYTSVKTVANRLEVQVVTKVQCVQSDSLFEDIGHTVSLVVPYAINGLAKAGQVVYCCFWITLTCQESLFEGFCFSVVPLLWSHYSQLHCINMSIVGVSAVLKSSSVPFFSKLCLLEMAPLDDLPARSTHLFQRKEPELISNRWTHYSYDNNR